MLQCGDGFGLDLEADALVFAGVLPIEQHLQGDEPLGLELPRLVDNAHAAAAQLLQDLVTRNRWPAASSGSAARDGRRRKRRALRGGGFTVRSGTCFVHGEPRWSKAEPKLLLL
jgi:hypothetical protein